MNKNAFVVILEYLVPTDKIDEVRPAHLEFLDEYYEKGVFFCSGRQNPIKGGVIMARGVSKEEVARIMDQDPFITKKLATYKIYEFTPTKYASELSSIFEG